MDTHTRTSIPTVFDNPCTAGLDDISGTLEVRSHTKVWLGNDGRVTIATVGGTRFSGADADGVRYTGGDRFKSKETFDLTTGAYTEKDGSVLRLISRGKTPNFSARLDVHRSWSPDKGFREHVVQDSVTCRP